MPETNFAVKEYDVIKPHESLVKIDGGADPTLDAQYLENSNLLANQEEIHNRFGIKEVGKTPHAKRFSQLTSDVLEYIENRFALKPTNLPKPRIFIVGNQEWANFVIDAGLPDLYQNVAGFAGFNGDIFIRESPNKVMDDESLATFVHEYIHAVTTKRYTYSPLLLAGSTAELIKVTLYGLENQKNSAFSALNEFATEQTAHSFLTDNLESFDHSPRYTQLVTFFNELLQQLAEYLDVDFTQLQTDLLKANLQADFFALRKITRYLSKDGVKKLADLPRFPTHQQIIETAEALNMDMVRLRKKLLEASLKSLKELANSHKPTTPQPGSARTG